MGISEHLAQTGNRGFGLKTMVPIKQGDFVIEYRGEVRPAHPLQWIDFPLSPFADASSRLGVQIISRDESYRRVLTTYADKTS